MEVRRDGTLGFHINGVSLGNAFKNSRLTSESLFPWVYIMDQGDCLEILNGA